MAKSTQIPENVTHVTVADAIITEARTTLNGMLLNTLGADNAITKWASAEKTLTEKAKKTAIRREADKFRRRVVKVLSTHAPDDHVDFPATWDSLVKTCEAIDAGFKDGTVETRGKWIKSKGRFQFTRLVSKTEQDEIAKTAQAENAGAEGGADDTNAGAEGGTREQGLPEDVQVLVSKLMAMDEKTRKATTSAIVDQMEENALAAEAEAA